MQSADDDDARALLQVGARVPGAATSPVVDFLIPGLEGLHFVAYGGSQGSVVVAFARQLDHIGSACQDKAEQQQLQTLLVLDLHRPEASATAFGASTHHVHTSPTPPVGGAAAARSEWAQGARGDLVSQPVLQVAFGGGPHLLVAAATSDTLAVVSLEGLAAHLFQQQTSSAGCSDTAAAGQQALWQQLAAVHCGHAELLAISWTQQLDGILTSSSDGTLTMWHLRPLVTPSVPEQQPLCLLGSASMAATAALRAAWSVHSPIPQSLVCAGVNIYAPSATAAGHAPSICSSPGSKGSARGSPRKAVSAAAGGGRGSPASSPARDGGAEGERYASVWWPQHREQRQRHYAGGMPSVGQEKLRHPGPVTGLQWSPGVLQKDVLAMSAGGGAAGAAAGGSPAGANGAEPGSPTTAAAVAATEADDHPALMTLTEDGTVRIWVETLVLTDSNSCSGGLTPSHSGSTEAAGTPSPARGPSQLRRVSPGAGSPGAAPSSPRDVRAAAAAAAALGAAAPAITSYFCMALVIDPAATAAGAAAAGTATAATGAGRAATSPSGSQHRQAAAHMALWARHAGPLLLHKQHRRVAAPALWLFTAAVLQRPGGHTCQLLLHLHAVRGLAAIVMSAGYGGSLSSTSGASKTTRPAAVLWGQHRWELPAAAADASPAQLLQQLCCWVSDEAGFPLLHAFTSSSSRAAAGGTGSTLCGTGISGAAGSLLLAGRTFSTVQEDGAMAIQVHKQLAVASTWQAEAVTHEQPITAFAAEASGNGGTSDGMLRLASVDRCGRLLLWDGPHLRHRAAVPAAAVGSTAALAWLPLCGAATAAAPAAAEAGRQPQPHWLAVGSGSMLQCYAISSQPPVAVATAALPAGCSSIQSLHALPGGSGSSSSSDASSSAGSCLLLAACSSSTGRGSVLCAWRCTAAALPQGDGSGMQLQPAGTAAVPAAAAVMAAGVAGGTQLLLGLADSSVLLVTVTAGPAGLQLQAAARLQEQGPLTAVAADEGCLHVATSSSGDGIAVWAAAATGSDPSATCHYTQAARVQLPEGAGSVTAAAWLHNTVAPCLAVATSRCGILLLSAVRHGSSWQWIARLPALGGAGAAISHLSAGSGCSSVTAVVGNQLLRLSEAVLLPASEQRSGRTVLLGRLLLDTAGPLPQYHPAFLSALILSGRHDAAAAVLQRLAAWLAALKQHGEAGAADEDAAGLGPAAAHPGSDGVARAAPVGSAELPLPLFSGLPLAELLDEELVQLPRLLDKGCAAAALGPALQAQQQQPQQPPPAGCGLESGMLDMAAFGFGPAAEAPTLQQQQTQQQAQAPAAGSGFESGTLDLAAWGMAPPSPPAAATQQQAQPPAAGGGVESGTLDLAAWGMAPPSPPAAATQQQAWLPAAGGGVESGTLDLAAWGMAPPSPPAAATQQQQQQQRRQQQQIAQAREAYGNAAAAPSGTLPAAAGLGGAGSSQSRRQLPQPPRQPTLPAQALAPIPAGCCQQLRELLLPPRSADGSDDEAVAGRSGAAERHLAGSIGQQQGLAAGVQVAAPIPGLTADETATVLAIAEAFCQLVGAGPGAGSASGATSATIDAAAARYIAAVSLACATGGADELPSGGGGSKGAASEQAGRQPPRPVTVVNAAGVAYTLAPAAVVSLEEPSPRGQDGSMGKRWGLLPGLDATAVVWALLSGMEEQMLQQGLSRLQQQEVAAGAAAAAAQCRDSAAFLAVRTAARAERGLDQPPTWAQLRQLGAGFWLREQQLLAATAERLAKQQFAARRNADDCALLYCALGKRTVLQGLYRTTQNRKLSEFLSRDFAQEQHRAAAQKNAFVLLGQHRHELAAAFFILGGSNDEAVGVAANEMADPQLALVLCRLLFGGPGSSAELRLLDQLLKKAAESAASDAAAVAAACCWLQADTSAALGAMLAGEHSRLAASAMRHAAQLLPLLHMLLAAVPPPAGEAQRADWQHQLQACLWALAAALRGCGLHALAVQAAAARLQASSSSSSQDSRASRRREQLLLHQLLAEALLPAAVEQHQHQRRPADAEAAYQLELLQQRALPVDAAEVLARLRRMRRSVLSGSEEPRGPAWAPSTLVRQQSSGGSSYRSRESEQLRWQHQPRTSLGSTAVVGERQVLFRVDNDKLEAVACCPLMLPDVLGRPVAVASHRMGLVEGQLHIVPPEPLSPLQAVPESPEVALEEEQQQRGGMFSRLLSQVFDHSFWYESVVPHGTAGLESSWLERQPVAVVGVPGAEFDVVGGAADTAGAPSPQGTAMASSIHTTAITAHPHKQLYLSGCNSGRLHLWQFGEQRALATYTPVPGSELDSISRTFSGLLSFSRSFKQSAAAPRLANWGKAAAVRFAPSGERFAAVGEGGVVATWRLDAPTRQALQADGDGHGCAEWWHQALSKQGCAVDFVGGSSTVLVVGGRCLPGSTPDSLSSNLGVWDTMAPTASSCVGRLANHQHTVTAVSMLPGGWLLAAGDSEGGLSCTDLRMMGGTSGPRLLWSVKAARGSLRSLAVVPTGGVSGASAVQLAGGSSALLATAGADGALRIWRGGDGRLLQSIEAAHFSTRPSSGGSRRSSYDGGAAQAPAAGHAPPGAHPLPAAGLVACEEGLVSCGADGCVCLFPFLS